MSLLINEEPCDHLSISLDIGGNIGWYTGFFTALGCQVVSVEAQGYATRHISIRVLVMMFGTGQLREILLDLLECLGILKDMEMHTA
ncbi:unnamed protein product [Bathycoccus prasinos]